jgi:site-specific DNA-methyltransferase (cytosine-N4-specific)
MSAAVLTDDCRAVVPRLECDSVQTCITSPPYWGGLRDYGSSFQFGLERDPSLYVYEMVEFFRGVRRLLRDDGTLWLNVGDVYAASGKGGGGNRGDRKAWETVSERKGFRMPPEGYKQKDLTLVAFALANAMRVDGWYLRSTIIWRKPAAVEPMRIDRPAVSHEYVFLFSKQEKYFARDPGEKWWGHTVWDIRTDADGSHPAAMPTELARRCIVASTEPGQMVLDPFGGIGTTAYVAQKLGRESISIELNPDFAAAARARLDDEFSLFAVGDRPGAAISLPEGTAE